MHIRLNQASRHPGTAKHPAGRARTAETGCPGGPAWTMGIPVGSAAVDRSPAEPRQTGRRRPDPRGSDDATGPR
ncbi:hypothetical protein TBS_16170 [Thermobispora bispora]